MIMVIWPNNVLGDTGGGGLLMSDSALRQSAYNDFAGGSDKVAKVATLTGSFDIQGQRDTVMYIYGASLKLKGRDSGQ